MGANGMRPLLQLRSLAVGHGKEALITDIDLELSTGQCVALIGVNGGGKSTLLNTLAGLLLPLRGGISVDG